MSSVGKRKAIISGMLGNGLEWYDYALYGHVANVISKSFFPAEATHQLVYTYIIFAIGFISRPAGAIFFGRLGDKMGRKKALTASMLLMAIPTGCMGLLPTYEMIGIGAPIMLIIIRLLQGFSLGGAYSGSISYVVEHAEPHQRAVVGSVIKLSLVIGFLMGSSVSTIVASLMTEEQFFSWGWRLPFFVGVLIGVVGFYIRNHGEESPVYEQAKKDGLLSSTPVKDTFFKYPKNMLQAFMTYIFVTIPFYVIAIYMISYSKNELHLSQSDSLLVNTIAMASMLLPIYPAARLADKIGRRPVLLSAIAAMLLITYPAFTLMQSGIFINVLIAQVGLAMCLGWYLAPIPATLVEMFPTSIRNTGMSLAYNLCAIIGGSTPFFAQQLLQSTENPMSVMWLLIGAGALTFSALLVYKDRWREPLPV